MSAILRRRRAELPEVKLAARPSQEAIRDDVIKPGLGRIRAERLVRWHPLGVRCRQARGERGWGFRDASVVTQIPQYRIRAIEDGRLSLVRADLARRYFRALRIESWVARWIRANRQLAERAGLGVMKARG